MFSAIFSAKPNSNIKQGRVSPTAQSLFKINLKTTKNIRETPIEFNSNYIHLPSLVEWLKNTYIPAFK